ncbi:monooxygenase fad-binding protein [Diplodia corticola]|uniref:Monooxygenase fad-binding protein n=1 Tax=Diplodia corticola TaxID=236234 RepID=A0A1J9QXA5_9PEZI|nr:monooxygenase fad-binding protein [Diplodia corticola]OJD33017.1 monooxygenase fad-binding protein [Diplodia corticola]
MASSNPQTRHILISGAGIAGPVLAFWLHRAGNIQCTIVERSPAPRTTGQQVDIRGEALEIVRRMGLEDAVRSATVQERGMAIVDGAGKHVAEFGSQEGAEGGKSFTADVEILRGELARVLYEATKGVEGVEYVWGNSIAGVTEVDGGVVVRFAKELGHGEEQRPERQFDLVVAADGMNSKTRGLVFDDADALKDLGQHMAYFTILPAPSDTRWATWYNAPRGRLVFLRPDLDRNRVGAYLAVTNNDDVPRNYLQLSVPEQMKMWDDLFRDAGGESQRAIRGMYACDDFYMQQIAQVKMPRWTKGRVALLGDAGYCPSPITGKGTSLAIIGAYVLAGELSKHRADHEAALAAYEDVMRPVVEKAQKIGPGAPAIANPQTQWGISILNGFLGAVSWTGLAGWFQGFLLSDKLIDLPPYDM